MGLHYLEDGQWVESEEVVEPTPFGAVAPRLAYRASFAANLNTAGAIELAPPDGGKPLRSHFLCLRLTDTSSGRNQIIARIKDAVGEIVPPNHVWYRDAFEGLMADVRCIAARDAFEADVVLRESPELPAGFDPKSTRLEIISEFLDPPEPLVRPMPVDPVSGWVDEELDFGGMLMIQGRVLVAGTEKEAVQVSDPRPVILKHWQTLGDRRFLIESIEFPALRPLIGSLPAKKVGSNLLAGSQVLPPAPLLKPGTGPLRLASSRGPLTGVVIDYVNGGNSLGAPPYQRPAVSRSRSAPRTP